MKIRPKDVANEYMHRFLYYIPNVKIYCSITRYCENTETITDVVYPGTGCVTAVIMKGCELSAFSRMPERQIIRRTSIPWGSVAAKNANSLALQHGTHLRYPRNMLNAVTVSVYCFDTFSIDNRFDKEGSVLYAKHRLMPRWLPLTDMAALTE